MRVLVLVSRMVSVGALVLGIRRPASQATDDAKLAAGSRVARFAGIDFLTTLI